MFIGLVPVSFADMVVKLLKVVHKVIRRVSMVPVVVMVVAVLRWAILCSKLLHGFVNIFTQGLPVIDLSNM